MQNKIPPMPKLEFSSWSEFNEVLEAYCNKHYLLFRAQDNRVQKHNSVKVLQIPNNMENNFKANEPHLVDTLVVSRIFDEIGILADAITVTSHSRSCNRCARSTGDITASTEHRKMVKSSPTETISKTRLIPLQSLMTTKLCDSRLTCGVVVRTAAQKQALVFKHWGETICTDWAYGMNNLGYYLGKHKYLSGTLNSVGSLLFTSSIGVSVLDFIALNETMETVEAILTFCKSNNKFWSSVETFVIERLSRVESPRDMLLEKNGVAVPIPYYGKLEESRKAGEVRSKWYSDR
ncbi:Hypothetical protein PHPALM_11377 [Phytophthora palmivora]|uniref:ZSWIM1/3 RNaseH-like domain-containing protein n=1 Tax=Phytophthora palmivora TaxID=4796 RepID=A0A2P4Y2F2_9STRA|nr:Hypothetical protein PHPALM_11377 [Phytophthora palmivora]